MKILHIINRVGGGGRERRMASVVLSMSKDKKYDQAILCLSQDDIYPELEKSNIPIHVVRGNRFLRIRKYISLLRSFSPDIVHSWIETPTEMFFFSFAKIIYQYKYIAGYIADGNKYKELSTVNLAAKFSFRCADKIVSNSRCGLVAKKAPVNKSIVIYNGFDFKRIHQIDRKAKRVSLSIDSECSVVMCASMTKVKDWYTFLKTAKMAQDKEVHAKFIAVGGGSLLEENKRLANEMNLGNILFLGKRLDVEEILMASDISVLLTNNDLHAEGVSNSILESMAIGLPVIASKGGGTEEIISDKDNGFIIEPKNVEQVLNTICFLINHPNERNRIGVNAKKTIEDRFLYQDKMREYCSLYDRVLK